MRESKVQGEQNLAQWKVREIQISFQFTLIDFLTEKKASMETKDLSIALPTVRTHFVQGFSANLLSVQNRAREEGDGRSDGIYDWKIRVCSENNFPTAAGLASSAAGYACLVYALAQLYNISSDLTTIARRGSGSACRSLHGGFVRWHQGTLNDGSDSRATQIADSRHWPDLRVLILIVSGFPVFCSGSKKSFR